MVTCVLQPYLEVGVVCLEGGGDAAGAHDPIRHGVLCGIKGVNVYLHGQVAGRAPGHSVGVTPISDAIPGEQSRSSRPRKALVV